MFDFDVFPNYKKDKFLGKINVSEAYSRKRDVAFSLMGLDSYYRGENKRLKEQKEFLESFYTTLTKEQVEFIKDEIEQSEGGDDFEIIKQKPSCEAEWLKGYDKPLMQVWVDQTCGMSGDDYSGYVYIEIIENEKYLKWFYAM